MRSGGGKSKGGAYEREICKKLSLWITKDKRDDIFWRSAMSGGRATVSKKRDKVAIAAAGDISAVDKAGYPFTKKFYNECKAYKDLRIKGLIKDTGMLYTFWIATQIDAEEYSKVPILWCKENNFPQFVCLTQEGLYFLKIGIPQVDLISPRHDLYLITQDAFFTLAKPLKKSKKRKRL